MERCFNKEAQADNAHFSFTRVHDPYGSAFFFS